MGRRKKFNGITLDEWFENLILNVLPYRVYEKYSYEECAWLVLNFWENSAPHSWGWSWGSWLSYVVFAGNEFYEKLSYKKKKELDEALLDYVIELSEKVEEKKLVELEKELKKLFRID